MSTASVTDVSTEVNPEWIAVNLPFSWGLEDSCKGYSIGAGPNYFAGAHLGEYLRGWNAGLTLRIRNLFGWEDARQVEHTERRRAIIAAAREAEDYVTARTCVDTALVFDRELYASWPARYRAERFAA